MKKVILSVLSLSLFFASCSNDDDNNGPSEPLGAYEDGIIVSGESSPAGTVSFVSEDLTTVENQIYFNVNNESLGMFLQSIAFEDGLAYIVTDNSNTITVVDRYTFEKQGTITTGLSIPRYMTIEDGKGYVTNWGDPGDATDDFIAVVDLATNTVTSTIAVGEGPEQIIEEDDVLYVSHKGGYGSNNIISVINTTTNALTSTITVNDNPDEMVFNDNGELVVLSSGKAAWTGAETLGAITKINPNTNAVISTMEFATGAHPELMAYSDGNLYYNVGNSIYSISDNATALATTEEFTVAASYLYGMSADDGFIYLTDATDFSSAGKLLIYNDATSTLVSTLDVAAAASKIYFN